MTAETLIVSALTGLVAGRVFPEVAPESTVRPYLTYQQVGGSAINFIDSTSPSKRNARFQINVWADTRASTAVLAGQVETAMRAATSLQTTVLGSPVASYEPDTKLRGTTQDFSVWVDA